MNTCEKCGAYIPIGETACPACGYDPAEQEKRAAEEARRKAAEEARRRAAEAEAEKRRAREEQQRKAREEQQKQSWQQGGAQYAYQSTPHTEQTWAPPWEQQQRQQPQYARPTYYRTQSRGKAKNKWVALALCAFTGWFGGHKFYEEKYGMGLLYLCTSGLFGIGWLVDLIKLATQPNETYYVE